MRLLYSSQHVCHTIVVAIIIISLNIVAVVTTILRVNILVIFSDYYDSDCAFVHCARREIFRRTKESKVRVFERYNLFRETLRRNRDISSILSLSLSLPIASLLRFKIIFVRGKAVFRAAVPNRPLLLYFFVSRPDGSKTKAPFASF